MSKLKEGLRSDLGKSISSGYVLFFVNNIVALFLTPYMLQFISKEEYGLYILCVDFLAWVGFLEFGTNKVIESKAGHLIAENNIEGLNKSFNASFFFQIVVSLLIFPTFYLMVYSGLNEAQLENVQLIVVLFSISAAFSVFRNLFSAIIISSKKVHLDNRIKLLNYILNYTLILLLVPFIGVLGLAIINVLTVILVLVRSNYRAKKLFPNLQIGLKFFRIEELKGLFSLGIYFSMGSLATLILLKIDSYIIGFEFGFEQVALFYITVKLFMIFQKVVQMVLKNFRPHIAQLYGASDFKSMHSFFSIITPFTLSITTIGSAVVMIFNEFFISLWVGKEFFLSPTFSILFGLWVMLELHTITSRIVLTAALYNLRWISFFRIFEALMRILIIYSFIDKGQLNILPISSVLACLLFGNIFFHFQVQRFFQLNQVMFKSAEIITPVLLVVLAMALLYSGFLYIFPYLLLTVGFVLGISTFLKHKANLKNLKFLIR